MSGQRAGRAEQLAAGSLAGAILLIVGAGAFQQARAAIETRGKGLDLAPVRAAVIALLHGGSIYADRRFVYPPTAAVALLPVSLGRYASTVDVWLVLCVIAVTGAGMLALAPWRRGAWPVLAALAAGLLVESDALRDSLWIGNISLLLAPVAVAVLLLYEAGRWKAGTVVLVASLLLKPLLLPLILIPLLRGMWRPVLEAALAGCLLLGVAVVAVPGGAHFFAILRFEEAGGSLTGHGLVYNIAITGVAQRLRGAPWGSAARIVVAALVVALAYRWARRPLRPGSVAAMGSLLLLGVFLAGSLSENNYLLVAAPCVLAALAAHPRRRDLLAALPALALLAVPRGLIGSPAGSPAGLQVRYLLAELLLAIAAASALESPERRALRALGSPRNRRVSTGRGRSESY